MSADELSRDEVFSVLSNRRRRWVVHYLVRDTDGRTDLRTLVDSLSAWEYDRPVEELSWKERKRLYTALRQSHLPKLDDVGIIQYDRSRGHVEMTDAAREAQLYLEYVPAKDIPWSLYYLGLTGVGVLLYLLSLIAVFPFAGLTGGALAGILLTMFAVSAITHHYHLRQSRLDARKTLPG